ncbi:MAG: hypothetical protein SFY80_04235 [Verrucomicrobiota bacterium]|nr:hypothetical protein [Verrucomicrobiota bacterium]
MFEYTFELANGRQLQFAIDPQRAYTGEIDAADHVEWARLGYHQCPSCPFSTDQVRHCPVAVDIQPIIDAFADIASSDEATVTVRGPEREYKRTCPVQRGLNSMLGLVMATSGCPILGRLRHMANFHLPFSTQEETLFRTVGSYLIRQYFVFRAGGEPDLLLTGLDAQYRELGEVNTSFAERIRHAAPNDASANAVVLFWSLSFLVNSSLDEQMSEEKGLFASDV